MEDICGALRDLVAFVQFKKREKHPWRSVNFSKVAGFLKTGPNDPQFSQKFHCIEFHQIFKTAYYPINFFRLGTPPKGKF